MSYWHLQTATREPVSTAAEKKQKAKQNYLQSTGETWAAVSNYINDLYTVDLNRN